MTTIAATKVDRVVASFPIHETEAFRQVTAFLANSLGSVRNSDDAVQMLLPAAESLATSDEDIQEFHALQASVRVDTPASALASPIKFELTSPLKHDFSPIPATPASIDMQVIPPSAAQEAIVSFKQESLEEWSSPMVEVSVDQTSPSEESKGAKRKAKKEAKRAKKALRKVKEEH